MNTTQKDQATVAEEIKIAVEGPGWLAFAHALANRSIYYAQTQGEDSDKTTYFTGEDALKLFQNMGELIRDKAGADTRAKWALVAEGDTPPKIHSAWMYPDGDGDGIELGIKVCRGNTMLLYRSTMRLLRADGITSAISQPDR